MTNTLLFAILAHWLVVQYVTESEIARPFREWVGGKRNVCYDRTDRYNEMSPPALPCSTLGAWSTSEWSRPKLKYLVTCRLCSGFWVAVGLGAALGFSPVKTLALAAASHWLFIAQRIAERAAK